MTKTLVTEAIRDLNEPFSIDELIEKLILVESFNKGKTEYYNLQTISHEDVGTQLEQWLK